MNYKLDYKICKELKDAGFPETEGGWIKRKGEEEWQPANACEMDERTFTGDEEDNKTPNPTLSELIEACKKWIQDNSAGCYWYDLIIDFHPGTEGYAGFWTLKVIYSTPINEDSGGIKKKKIIEITTEDLEEAVAKLWLKLNEHNN